MRRGLLTSLLLTAAMLLCAPALWRQLRGQSRVSELLTPAAKQTVTVWLLGDDTDSLRLLRRLMASYERQTGDERVFLRRADAGELIAPNAVPPDLLLFSAGDVVAPDALLQPLAGELRTRGDALSAGRFRGEGYAVPLWASPEVLVFPADWMTDDDAANDAPISDGSSDDTAGNAASNDSASGDAAGNAASNDSASDDAAGNGASNDSASGGKSNRAASITASSARTPRGTSLFGLGTPLPDSTAAPSAPQRERGIPWDSVAQNIAAPENSVTMLQLLAACPQAQRGALKRTLAAQWDADGVRTALPQAQARVVTLAQWVAEDDASLTAQALPTAVCGRVLFAAMPASRSRAQRLLAFLLGDEAAREATAASLLPLRSAEVALPLSGMTEAYRGAIFLPNAFEHPRDALNAAARAACDASADPIEALLRLR